MRDWAFPPEPCRELLSDFGLDERLSDWVSSAFGGLQSTNFAPGSTTRVFSDGISDALNFEAPSSN